MKMTRTAAALYAVAADQLGIFLQTRSSSFKQREELNLQLSPAMRVSTVAKRNAKSIHYLGNLQNEALFSNRACYHVAVTVCLKVGTLEWQYFLLSQAQVRSHRKKVCLAKK